MANQEHLDILKQGVEVWNLWRKEHLGILPDLSLADLSKAYLREINLSGSYLYRSYLYVVNLTKANLSRAYLIEAKLNLSNLSGADLSWANLSQTDLNAAIIVDADLNRADLSRADLSRADLSRADLSGANLDKARFNRTHLVKTTFVGAHLSDTDFSGADLKDVNLTGAYLVGSNFTEAKLDGANLSEAEIARTIFGNVDLSGVKGLDTVKHRGPSTIGIDTIYSSQGNIPEAFLKGAGVPETFINYARSLVGHPIDSYSCFISYSSKDEEFAKRLYADLQSNNVRCWFAPEDMKIGDKIRVRIDESIRMYDKLLLVLSEYSVESTWVEFEVETALAKEIKGKPTVLFPIRLDDAVMESKTAWSVHIKNTRHIGDFRGWKSHDDYKKAFDRLLRDLKAESQIMG